MSVVKETTESTKVFYQTDNKNYDMIWMMEYVEDEIESDVIVKDVSCLLLKWEEYYNANSANINRKRKISGHKMQRLYTCFKHIFSSSFRKGE